MGSRYKIRDQDGLYFLTFTIVGWVDLFIRNAYRDCLIDSLNYCMKHKGLRIHAFVIMTSHVHLIVSSKQDFMLQNTIRDLKKYTAKELITLIKTVPESRREWMLNKFGYEAQRIKRGSQYILWQEGYHGKQIETNKFLDQKINYIHENPVEAGFVKFPEEWKWSSAKDFEGGEIGTIGGV